MSCAIITSGGIGDCLESLKAASLYQLHNDEPVEIYVNSHQEIVDFINKCTYFPALRCPERKNNFNDAENPLNLPKEFLDGLFKEFSSVYSCFPDSLGTAPFDFPWFRFVKSYKEFIRTKVHFRPPTISPAINPDTKNIFIHATSITPEKNYSLSSLQSLVSLLNSLNCNIIICRASQWKGEKLPFFCKGKFYDLVDRPIEEAVSTLQRSDYFIGIDSSFAHIAYHLGIPRLVLQQHFNQPFHLARYHEDVTDDIPLNIGPEQIFNRVALNLREPYTMAIPAYLNIPHNVNTKQLLYRKYYD
jgi:hypothetical protein